MGVNSKKENGSKSFDLLNNPFSMLRIEPTADMDKITDAFDDAVADRIASEADLTATREIIINPRLRTAAELSFLIDTPAREAAAILNELRSKSAFNDLFRVADRLAPLSKANLLAHVAAHQPANADLLFALVDAQAQIDPKIVHSKLESVRRAAGIIIPSLDTVRDQLHELVSLQAKATFASFPTPRASVGPVEECTKRILAAADPDRVDALDGVMREFGQIIAPELSKIEEQFRSTAKNLLRRPNDLSLVPLLSNQLRSWSELARPLLELDAYKGRDEGRARQLFNEVRSLSIDLANEHQRFDSALSISKCSAEHFKLLPRAAEQLKEDLAVLEDRSAEEHIVPLKKLIDELRSSGLAMLLSDLKKSGFGEASTRETKELWKSFSGAVAKVQKTTAADLPWVLLQGLAIEINNEENEPLAAKAILDGLIWFAERSAPSEKVIDTIRDDLRTVQRNILEKKLIEDLKADRISPALEIVGQLLRSSTSQDEREPLIKIQGQLESKRNSRYIKWGFFGIVAAGILIASLSDKSPPRSTYNYPSQPSQPSYPSNENRVPAPVAPTPEDFAEVIPQVGTGLTLSRSNIRYCQYQKERFKPIEADLRHSQEISAFNRLVDDYNSRCGNFRYRESDLNAVTGEVISKSAVLAAEGRSILLSWRRESAPPRPPIFPQMVPETNQPTDLLQLENATNVQRRLNELGYFKGPMNGAWGPQSRMSLRSFKASNGLANDDLFDAATAEKMFFSSAVRASPSQKPAVEKPSLLESQYAPQMGATLNPLNKVDATKIHSKLRELGFYRSNSNTLWSAASRDALKGFKIANSLGGDDQWDAATELRLLSTQANEAPKDIRAAFEAVTGGVWSSDLRACPGGVGNTDALPLTITSKRAETESARCEFGEVSGQGQNWKTTGTCTANGQTWVANISLMRLGDTLTWTSERGTAKYLRCNN